MIPYLAALVVVTALNAPVASAQVREDVELPKLNVKLNVIREFGVFGRQAEEPANIPWHGSEVDADENDSALDARLDAWVDAYLHWLDQNLQLSDEQRSGISELIGRNVADRKKDSRRLNRGNAMFDSTVIVFAGQYGPATHVTRLPFSSQVKRLLSPEQSDRFDELHRKHLERIGELYAERAASIIAEILYLDRETYEAVFRAARWKIHYRSDGLFDFTRNTNGLTYRALTMFVQTLDEETLPSAYVRYWCGLRGSPEREFPQAIPVPVGSPDDDTLAQLHDAVQQHLFDGLTIQRGFLTTALNLDEAQSRRLKVAAQGAVIHTVRPWKHETVKTAREIASRLRPDNVPNQAIVARLQMAVEAVDVNKGRPTTQDVAEDPIWRRAVKDAVATAGGFQSEEFERICREGATAFILGTLTREMFLSPEQQDQLRPLIEATHPEAAPDQPVRELALVATAMLRIQEDKLSEVLDQHQQVCWNLIRTSFELQPDERSVLLPTRTTDPFFVLISPPHLVP